MNNKCDGDFPDFTWALCDENFHYKGGLKDTRSGFWDTGCKGSGDVTV